MTDSAAGRRLTRADITAAYGYSPTTLARWWADRINNGHPPARKEGRVLTWDAAEWQAWDRSRQETVGPAEFARMLGHADNSWVSKAAAVPPEGFPQPVEWGDPVARRRPKWRREDAQHYADTRTTTRPPTGAGTRPGSRRPSAPYAGDPRLAVARFILAKYPDERPARHIDRLHQLMPGSSASTWTKILQAARHQDT
ncbi:hypothetical protein [Streptomyces xanthophaeus]|uniref:hypothetical protein n=1 Tax=Streptomyces xanthophaeus TaxID=67385 RepID=UPI003710DDF4